MHLFFFLPLFYFVGSINFNQKVYQINNKYITHTNFIRFTFLKNQDSAFFLSALLNLLITTEITHFFQHSLISQQLKKHSSFFFLTIRGRHLFFVLFLIHASHTLFHTHKNCFFLNFHSWLLQFLAIVKFFHFCIIFFLSKHKIFQFLSHTIFYLFFFLCIILILIINFSVWCGIKNIRMATTEP